MTRDELTDRICELFPPLAEVKPWDWAETDEGEPVVLIQRHATFTGIADGALDLTTSIPNVEDRRLADRRDRPLRPDRTYGRSDRDGGGRAGEGTTKSRTPVRFVLHDPADLE
jgi:hypothetical protein